MPTRLVGLIVAAILGSAAAQLPLGDWWVIDSFVPIPGGLAAAFGIAVAGLIVAPRLQADGQRLGLVAVRFALVAFVSALPLIAFDAAVMANRPPDEPWPVTFGPVLGTVFGTVFYTPDLLLVAFPAAGVWTAITRYALTLLTTRRHVTFTNAD